MDDDGSYELLMVIHRGIMRRIVIGHCLRGEIMVHEVILERL
jgi:hypothetical protein